MNVLSSRRLWRFLLGLLIGISFTLVPGCPKPIDTGFTLWIGASIWGFAEDTEPEGLANAAVWLWDDYAWAPVPDAEVTVNGTPLTYYSGSDVYLGDPFLSPGDGVHLEVSVRGRTYAATGAMFTEYPAFTGPAPGTVWEAGSDQHVFWTGCEPVENAVLQWIAILDTDDPLGEAIYPTTYLPVISREHTFGARSISAGERLLTVNMGSEYGVPDATWDSQMLIWGGTTVPISVQGQYMSISPVNERIPLGNQVDYLAWVHSYYDGTSATVTQEAEWSCSDPDVATIGSDGQALPVGGGTAVITVSWEELSVSTGLTVLPWTVGSSGFNEYLYGIGVSSDLIVTVGRDGLILTSSEGTEWIQQDSGVSVHLNDVVWADTQFVAVGSSGTVLTSPNGVDWSAQDTGITTGLTGVAWSGTTFVAVGSDGIYSSPNGESWTERRDLTQLWSGVACSGTVFVAVGGVGALYSDDEGVTWNSCEGSIGSKNCICWTGDLFIAGGMGSTVSTSIDGITWNSTSITDVDRIYDCAGNGEHYVIVAGRTFDYAPLVIFSNDAETWDVQTLETGTVDQLAWIGEIYLALGYGRYVLIPPPSPAQTTTAARSSYFPTPAVSPATSEWLRSIPRRR